MKSVVADKPRKKTSETPRAYPSNPKKKSLSRLFAFRWLKKKMKGKSPASFMNLLDQWILKKKAFRHYLMTGTHSDVSPHHFN